MGQSKPCARPISAVARLLGGRAQTVAIAAGGAFPAPKVLDLDEPHRAAWRAATPLCLLVLSTRCARQPATGSCSSPTRRHAIAAGDRSPCLNGKTLGTAQRGQITPEELQDLKGVLGNGELEGSLGADVGSCAILDILTRPALVAATELQNSPGRQLARQASARWPPGVQRQRAALRHAALRPMLEEGRRAPRAEWRMGRVLGQGRGCGGQNRLWRQPAPIDGATRA